MTYEQRQKQPVTIPADLVKEIWSAVKSARDEAINEARTAQARYERLDALLKRARSAGMAEHQSMR